jgi:8-oxo-dGTP diphosphatase
MTRATTRVVAAVIENADGGYLLAQRPTGKVYAGYWEFPGGKVEAGESDHDALVREIREELDIVVDAAHPWLVRRHVYEHATVRIRFFRVPRWHGTPRGLDGQRFAFQQAGRESVGPMLPANGPVLAALRVPARYAISCAGRLGTLEFLARLDAALRRGLRLVLVREPGYDAAAQRRLAREVVARAREFDARVLLSAEPRIAAAVGADGVHLRAAQLFESAGRPDFALVGASTHDALELARAAELACDFAVLGPVLPTPTHPGAAGLGWRRFASLVEEAELPVFALGGMTETHLEAALGAGAHGVAMLRAAWPADDGKR